jgi:myosin-1
MKMIGFSADDEKSVFKVVAATIHLGNVKFAAKGDSCDVSTMDALNNAAELLELDPKALVQALTNRSITAGAGKAINKALSDKEAAEGCDALVKALYDRLFKWIVNRINENIQYRGEDAPEESLTSIGVLDIYGFEILQFNSFEQFCINYCNEKLQQLFIELTLKVCLKDFLLLPVHDVIIHCFIILI